MTQASIDEGIGPDTLAQLREIPIEPGRPLIAVDVDEVLVVFVEHLDRYIRTLGYEMRLERYELEGSIFPIGTNDAVPFDGCIELINTYFANETLNQQAVPGGRAVLERLAEIAQIVILTNVPRHATAMRRQNLDGLGLTWPMAVNSGGKGRAMAWLAAKAGAPAAIVDDSSSQLESVAKHAPEVSRFHFAWAEHIARLYPDCAHATRQVYDWPGTEQAIRETFGAD
ncbi:MAG: hypothetical protein AAGB15_13535 [Pseudomonadota bacterium]